LTAFSAGRETDPKGSNRVKRLIIAVSILVALTVASVAFAASTLSGSYTTKITGKGANTLNGALDGTWTLKLKNGKYSVKLGPKAEVHGNYTIKGNTISITDTGGPAKCKGTGKYKFKIKGSSATLTKVKDSKACVGREDVLAHKLTKVQHTAGY
jgi:hypothetical protein